MCLLATMSLLIFIVQESKPWMILFFQSSKTSVAYYYPPCKHAIIIIIYTAIMIGLYSDCHSFTSIMHVCIQPETIHYYNSIWLYCRRFPVPEIMVIIKPLGKLQLMNSCLWCIHSWCVSNSILVCYSACLHTSWCVCRVPIIIIILSCGQECI